MNQGLSVIEVEPRDPCAGDIKRMNLVASFPALWEAGSTRIRETGPERAGDELVLAEQVNRIRSGIGYVGGMRCHQDSTNVSREGGAASWWLPRPLASFFFLMA